MKKYKLIKSLLISAPLLITPLIANSCTVNANPASRQQILTAIEKFAKENKVDLNQINYSSIKYQANSVKNEQELITFNFAEKSNVKGMLLTNTYTGSMTYHTNKKEFSLNKWVNSKMPGTYGSSLQWAATIIGDGSGPSSKEKKVNFTLCLSSNFWNVFEFNYQNPKTTINQLFAAVGLSQEKVQYFKKNDFQSIEDGASHYATVDGGNFAVFQVINDKVVWTNLDSNQAANALELADNGSLASLALLNQTNKQYHLFLSNDVLKQLDEIYQLNNNFKTNQYLQFKYLIDHWSNKSSTENKGNDQVGIQIASAPDAFKNGNASIDDVVTCLLNLLKNDYSKLTEMLSKNYQAYNLIFNKTSGVWTFSSYSKFTN